MFMKYRKSAILILALAFCAALTLGLGACSKGGSAHEGVEVVYVLNGGSYRNMTTPVRSYYNFKSGTQNLIKELQDGIIAPTGYTLEGWYTSYSVDDDGNETFSGKWNFATDKVGDEGVTLYAKWMKNLVRKYEVCYRDDNGEAVVLGSYDVRPNDRFRDDKKFCDARSGYTAMRYADANDRIQVQYYDENGEPWDDSFIFPSTDSDYTVRVFVKHLEGTFTFVATEAQLKAAANANQGIYLLKDIDFGGDPITSVFSGFRSYGQTFLGNGHSVSNFVLDYPTSRNDLVSDDDLAGDNLLFVSLFRALDGATIKDVSFTGVSVTVRTTISSLKALYFAPIAVKMTNSKIENVTFSGRLVLEKLPSGFDESNFVRELENAYCYKDGASTVDGFTATVEYVDSRAA